MKRLTTVLVIIISLSLLTSCEKEPIYTDVDVYYEYSNSQENGFYFSYDVDGDRVDNEYCKYMGNGKIWRGMESGQRVVMSFKPDHNKEVELTIYLNDKVWKQYKRTKIISIDIEIP